jgi:ABC1 atypical kinase-like domain
LLACDTNKVAEASNAQRFNELYAGITDVFVPKIYSDFTTSKVLTMEWVDGFRLTDDFNMNLYMLDKSKMVDTLVQCSLKQILENGTASMRRTLCFSNGPQCVLSFLFLIVGYASSLTHIGSLSFFLCFLSTPNIGFFHADP